MDNYSFEERREALIKFSCEYFKEDLEEIKRVNKFGVATYNADYLLKLKNKKHYFCKLYTKDKWERMEREFTAISYLNKKKIIEVPESFFVNKKYYFAVYSYELGRVKPANSINRKDILLIAGSAVKLHSLKPTLKLRKVFTRPAGRACFKLENHIENYRVKMADFLEYFEKLPANDTFKKKIMSFGYLKRADHVLRKIISDANPDLMKKTIEWDKRRFNHGDFTIDNIIFRKEGQRKEICFVDFEYCGWDDPLRMIGDFLVHDRNSKLSGELKQLFLKEYIKKLKLNKKNTARLNVITDLMETEWIAVYLRLLIPQTLRLRKAVVKNFDEGVYVDQQLAKAKERILNLEQRLFS